MWIWKHLDSNLLNLVNVLKYQGRPIWIWMNWSEIFLKLLSLQKNINTAIFCAIDQDCCWFEAPLTVCSTPKLLFALTVFFYHVIQLTSVYVASFKELLTCITSVSVLCKGFPHSMPLMLRSIFFFTIRGFNDIEHTSQLNVFISNLSLSQAPKEFGWNIWPKCSC